MVEHKIQSGYIKCMDKPYIFTYDGDLLQLVPKDEESIKPYDFLINKNMNYDVLEEILLDLIKYTFELPLKSVSVRLYCKACRICVL